jgi:hypothetical protein
MPWRLTPDCLANGVSEEREAKTPTEQTTGLNAYVISSIDSRPIFRTLAAVLNNQPE